MEPLKIFGFTRDEKSSILHFEPEKNSRVCCSSEYAGICMIMRDNIGGVDIEGRFLGTRSRSSYGSR